MKHYFVTILEEGEKEHSFPILTTCEDGNIQDHLDELCSNWYDEEFEDDDGEPMDNIPNEDGKFEFEMGSIIVSVQRYEEVSPEHYLILQQYITEL